jgi:hypothetical protein
VRTAAGLLLILFAAAFTFTPAADAPRLSVERSTYEVPIPGGEVAVRFTLTPPLGQGRDHVIICHNQHFDRSKLDRDGGCLEKNANGAAIEDGHGETLVMEPGRYEAYAQRQTVENDEPVRLVSNVVSFDVFDLCHFVADVVPLPPTFTMLPGAPAACSGAGMRHVTLHADDGSRLRIEAAGMVFWGYDTRLIRVPMLQINGQGKQVTLDFRAGPRLGRIAAEVLVPAATLFTTGAVDLSITHSNGTAVVRVRRGTVVGFRLAALYAASFVRQACPGRPTLRCLKKIHYTVGGLKKRQEYGKVIRAGQKARFVYRGVR